MAVKYTTESFYRAITTQSISRLQSCPFDLQVSELPLNSSGLVTIDPNTESEEILYYSAKNSTTMKLTISKRGVLPNALDLTTNGVDYNNTTYQFDHWTSSVIRGDVNHIHLNQILDPTGNTTFSGNNTFTGTNTFTNATVSAILQIPTFASTAARDAAIPSPTGKEICIVTGTGYMYYSGGGWQLLAVGTPTPDGTETIAGKWEGATVAEQGTATDTGGTGAHLVPMNKNLVKNYVGSSDANKIAILGTNGDLNNFVKPGNLSSVTYSWLTTSDKYIIDQSGTLKYTTPAEFLQMIQNVMKASNADVLSWTEDTKYITSAKNDLTWYPVASSTIQVSSDSNKTLPWEWIAKQITLRCPFAGTVRVSAWFVRATWPGFVMGALKKNAGSLISTTTNTWTPETVTIDTSCNPWDVFTAEVTWRNTWVETGTFSNFRISFTRTQSSVWTVDIS